MPLPTSPAGVFPLYLLPSNPFRRRASAATYSIPNENATALSASAPSTSSYLSGSLSVLRCNRCLAHICPASSIISKGFNGRWGRAFLVAPPARSLGSLTPPCELDDTGQAVVMRHHQAGNLPNTHVHKPQPRMLVTGAHVVSDISCVRCGSMLGWKYVDAEEEGQKYKVGNYILEMKRVTKGVDWENDNQEVDNHEAKEAHVSEKPPHVRKDSAVSFGDEERGTEREIIEFDSEDEDECEDLFMGIWTPALAKKRRRAKAWKDERDIV